MIQTANSDECRKRWAKLLPIIQAYSEGKTIQTCYNGKWKDDDFFNFSSEPEMYRIKPDPEYRPYDTSDDVRHLVGSTVLAKNSHSDYVIDLVSYRKDHIVFGLKQGSVHHKISAAGLMTYYVTTDLNPLGVIEDELICNSTIPR